MKLIYYVSLLSLVFLSSCTSEYEERLEEAKRLKERLSMIEESNFISPKQELLTEMKELEAEINLLAKVSGNEDSFYADLDRH